MKLKSVRIKNYRSIEDVSFDINHLDDGTCTYGLIGVNEAGKSSILKALALKDGLKDEKGNPLPLLKDFKNKTEPIEIVYNYFLSTEEQKECKDYLSSQATPIESNGINFKEIILIVSYDSASPGIPNKTLEIVNVEENVENKDAVEDLLIEIIIEKMHEAIFWTAEDRYLISQPINLSQFAANPDVVSIPLKNCFSLAGVDIQSSILLINDSTEREALKDSLGEEVTRHINTAWPKHKIKITFDISDGLINFHVHDLEAKGKAKTADQRSDGFRQFISFLLTVSAQSKNGELSNYILLLDEPETHLHPQAQEDLLTELVKITDNKKNNIVFFATHSNYMIDKDDLSRNYKIVKNGENTEKEQFSKKNSTYASVTYEVFEIASTDYHNELYGYLEENNAERLNGLRKDKKWINQKTNKTDDVSLATYIRHSIHHPENILNKKFTKDELFRSIEVLKKLRYEK